MCSGLFFSSFVESWPAFLFLYAVMYPVGIGVCYFVPIICGWEYFPTRKGLVSGIILCGYGLGAFFFGFISTAIANPNDEKPIDDKSDPNDGFFPRDVADNVPRMLQICVAMWAVLCIISVATVTRNPAHQKQEEEYDILAKTPSDDE